MAKLKIKQLRQRTWDIRAAGKEKLARYKAIEAQTTRTAEDDAELAQLDGELNKLTADLNAAEMELTRAEEEAHREALLSVSHDPRLGPRVPGVNPRAFVGMFGTALPAGITLEDWFKSIHTGMWRQGIEASMVGSSGTDGGFAVPQEFAARMLDTALESEIVRPRARIEPMLADTKRVAGFDLSDHTSGNIGGFTVQWVGEATSLSAQKGKLRAIALKARKAAILVEASNELLADGGQTFDGLLNSQLAAGVAWGMDDAFLNGNGGAQPRGVLADPAIISIAKESGQSADTIVYENLVKMFARLHPACVGNSVWVANSSCLPQLLTLQQKIKNVAGTENVGGSWIPVLREDGSGNMTLLTRPLLLTEKLPQLGDSGDIILADFSQYIVGLRADFSLAKSSHAGFESDTSFYRVIARVDGQGSWKGPLKPKTGQTLSWVIKLDERA